MGHEASPQGGLGVGCKLCSSSKNYVDWVHDSNSSPDLRGFNSDVEAWEHGLESHEVKAFGTVN